MATVYSTLLFSGIRTGPAGFALYTVPAGKVAVLRDADILAQTAAGVVLLLDQTPGVNFANLTFPAALSSVQWTGRQVFPAGQIIAVNIIAAATFQIRLSGYLLDA